MSFRKLYFGYGGNMLRKQMADEAPDSQFVGVGFIKGWKWIISTRGFANIVRSPGDVVYGLVYTISAADEASLDVHEGVPDEYVKQTHIITFGTEDRPNLVLPALFYIDVQMTQPGTVASQAYTDTINGGIEDATAAGVPEDYIDEYLRPFIPADDENY